MRGSCGGGLRVIVAPVAIAGAILWAASSTGKLNGVIPTTGESGKRRVIARRPAPTGRASVGRTSPPMRVASSAASRKTKIARSSSTRAWAIGLPASSARVRARSVRPAARPSATRRSIAARSKAGRARHAAAAAMLASSAARTSAEPASSTTPTSLPSCGARITALSRGPLVVPLTLIAPAPPPRPGRSRRPALPRPSNPPR